MNKFAESQADDLMKHAVCVVGLAFVLLTSGCAGVKTPPPLAPSQSSPPQVDAVAVPPAVPQPPLASASPPTVEAQVEVAPVEPTIGVAPPTGASTNQPTSKSAPPVVKAPAKSTAPPASPAQPLKKELPPQDVAKPKAQPLDLTSLEQRLKDSKAIGVLTKITLKNQVDDLLNEFRAFYQGKLHTTLADLRRSYDLLVLKVLSLLQDHDQALATAIAASREAIWGVLSDPAKFATI